MVTEIIVLEEVNQRGKKVKEGKEEDPENHKVVELRKLIIESAQLNLEKVQAQVCKGDTHVDVHQNSQDAEHIISHSERICVLSNLLVSIRDIIRDIIGYRNKQNLIDSSQ